MNDSSDDDDLEALRLEALKSLRPRDPANTDSQRSISRTQALEKQNYGVTLPKQSQDHFPESKKYEKTSESRNHLRNESIENREHRVNFHPSAKLQHSALQSPEKTSSIKNQEFYKCDSGHRNARNPGSDFKDSRLPFQRDSRCRNLFLRGTHSPDQHSSLRSNNHHSNSASRKYPTRSRNRRSISPSRRRNSRSPHRTNQQLNRSSSSKSLTTEAIDPLSSLPLCSPKHYVELFYGKKLSASNLDIMGDSDALILNEEDCALLSEKSNLENIAIKSVSIESKPNESLESHGSSEKLRRKLVSHGKSLSGVKETPPNDKYDEGSLHLKKSLTTKPSRLRNRYPSERPATELPRRPHGRKLHESEPNESHSSERISSDLGSSRKKKFDDETEVSATKMNETLDPVLEARRKKFESNDMVKAVPKKMKLTNQHAGQNPVPIDESDLRNLLLAKHRVKALSAVSLSKGYSISVEDHKNLSASSPLNTHSDPDGSEFVSGPLMDDNNSISNSKSEQSHPEVNYPDQANCSTTDQVKIKKEVETDEIVGSNEDAPLENTNSENNLKIPTDSISLSDNMRTGTSENFASKDDTTKTNYVPIFESADYLSTVAVKEEPFTSQCEESHVLEEEKPFIDEPDLIPQQPDKVEDTSSSAPFIKIKPLTELLDKKVLKKVKKSKRNGEKKSKKRKKKSKSKDKDKHKESRLLKMSKRSSKNLAQDPSRAESFPTRLVRSALEEALGKKKRKTFESDDASPRKANSEHQVKKDSRKVLILNEPTQEQTSEESSPHSIVSTELKSDNSSEDSLQNERINFRLSSEAPLYSSKKRKKKPDIYRMIQLNQV